MDDYRDAVSSLTHLFTAGWAAFATLVLLRLTRGHGPGRWAVGVYGLTMVVLYAASGTFHGLLYLTTSSVFDPDQRAAAVRDLWVAQRLDKAAIFALIAGSYTPVFVYLLRGSWRRVSLALMWGAAAVGMGAIWLWPKHPHELLVGVYVGMGLVGMLPMRKYMRKLGWRNMAYVVVFAGAYVGGAVVEVAQWPTLIPGYFGPHEFLHVADMVGTFVHFAFVVKVLIRRKPYGVPLDDPPPPDRRSGAREDRRAVADPV